MTRTPHILVAVAASAIAAASPATAQTAPPGLRGAPPIVRQFEDWMLACDNRRICRAQPRSDSGSLMVRRDPGPAGEVTIVLDGQDPTAGPSVPDLATISIDGRRVAAPWRLDREREAAVLDGAAALRFVRLIADAGAVTYRASGESLEVSLAGLKAALLAMDEAQGRLATPTAFIRPGARPLAEVPAAVELPVVAAAPAPPPAALPAAFAARVREAGAALLSAAECTEEVRGGDQAYALSATEAIVILECGYGAVSTSYLLVRASREATPAVARITLPPVPRSAEEQALLDGAQPIYSDVEWDPETASITSSGHSCAGTCGEISRWVFDGRDFVLASHSIYEGGGAEVLDLYRTAVRPPGQ